MKYKVKSKRERQLWFKRLSPEQRNKFVEKKVQEKSKIKLQKMKVEINKSGKCYDCKKCFHGQIESCTDQPIFPKGCLYFYSPKLPDTAQGLRTIKYPVYHKVA